MIWLSGVHTILKNYQSPSLQFPASRFGPAMLRKAVQSDSPVPLDCYPDSLLEHPLLLRKVISSRWPFLGEWPLDLGRKARKGRTVM